MNNPLGVGSYDRFAIPRRAYVARITARGDRLEIAPEIERLEKFLREYRLGRGPPGSPGEEEGPDLPPRRYGSLASGRAGGGPRGVPRGAGPPPCVRSQ